MLENTKNRITNCLAVLKSIDKNAGATSQIIAGDTGLSISTISRTLSVLKSHNLLVTSKTANGELGRNPDRYLINPNYGYYLYCNITTDVLRLYLLNFNGEVKTGRHIDIAPDYTPELLAEHINDFIDHLMSDTLIAREQLIALAVSLPGIVDRDRKGVHRIPNLPHFENTVPAETIRNKTSLPCFIANSAQLTALGAQRLYAPEADSFVYIDITYDYGIGGGIVLNHELYAGKNNNAGEIGDMIVDVSSMGSEKSSYTLESSSGIHALYRQIQNSMEIGRASGLTQLMERSGKDRFDLKMLEHAAAELDLDVLDILNHAAKAWAAAIINMISVLSPDTIMVGGAISDETPLIKKMLLKHIGDLYYKPVDLRFDKTETEAHLAGAVQLFKQYLYEVALTERL